MELSEYDEKVLQRGINLMRLGGFLFLGIGLLFFVLGSVFLAFTQRKAQVYVETQGVIVDFDRDGHPYVAYEAQGQTYEQRSNYASSTMRLGDELTVRYDPQAPYRMEAGGAVALFLPLMFMGMGGVQKKAFAEPDGRTRMRRWMPMGITADERVCSGAHYAAFFADVMHLIASPEDLEVPPENVKYDKKVEYHVPKVEKTGSK